MFLKIISFDLEMLPFGEQMSEVIAEVEEIIGRKALAEKKLIKKRYIDPIIPIGI
jgi:hypothetical protein